MTKTYSKKAYLALFNLLDSRYDNTQDSELGRLLSDMNPYLFDGDLSADSACFEDFLDCCDSNSSDEVHNAYNASIKFLKLYYNEFGFEIIKIIDEISFKEYEVSFNDNIM